MLEGLASSNAQSKLQHIDYLDFQAESAKIALV